MVYDCGRKVICFMVNEQISIGDIGNAGTKSEDADWHPRSSNKYMSFPEDYPRNEISTPAATAEPMTPEMLDDMQ